MGINICTLLLSETDNQQGPTVYSTGNSTQYCNNLPEKIIWKTTDTCITESLCCKSTILQYKDFFFKAPKLRKREEYIWASLVFRSIKKKRYLHLIVHSNTVYRGKDMEAIQMSIKGLMDKDVVYTHTQRNTTQP